MRRLIVVISFALITAAFIGAGATAGFANPTETIPCTGCHRGAGATVVASLVSNNGTTATYKVTASGANAIAVFSGSTKLSTITAASGQFSVAAGKTYTIYAVTGPTTSSGIGSASITPAANDTVAPTTVSNAQPSYLSTATITMTPKDNVGGSGIAVTHYVVDGGAQSAGKTVVVSAAGAHSLAFWSVDIAGNVEAQKTATFTVGIAAPTTLSLSTSSAVVAFGAKPAISGTLQAGLGLAGKRVVVQYSTDKLTWRNAATVVTTDATGTFTFSVSPTVKTYYRVRYPGEAYYIPCVSSLIIFTPRVYLSTPYAPRSIAHLRTFTAYGYLKPRHTAGTSPVRLMCYRYASGKWVLKKTVLARAANYSTYTKVSSRMSLPSAGRWRIRAYHAADTKNAATYSAYRYVTVK